MFYVAKLLLCIPLNYLSKVYRCFKYFVTFFNFLHLHTFNGPFPGLPRWACTRKVKPIWILVKQETVSGSGISWAICKSAPHSRQITTPAPHHSVFCRPDALPAAKPTGSKHWRLNFLHLWLKILKLTWIDLGFSPRPTVVFSSNGRFCGGRKEKLEGGGQERSRLSVEIV